jgi:hypothetical protein
MRYNLFIDDERDPNDVTWLSATERTAHLHEDWYIVRSYAEAIETILTFGCMPQIVSFDHDLGECARTGYDLAKWMVAQALAFPSAYGFSEDFWLIVHSKNPVGAGNIKGYFDSYFRHLENNG